MEKRVHFYHYLLIIPPSPINVELQVFHLTLTLKIDNHQFSPQLFLSKMLGRFM